MGGGGGGGGRVNSLARMGRAPRGAWGQYSIATFAVRRRANGLIFAWLQQTEEKGARSRLLQTEM